MKIVPISDTSKPRWQKPRAALSLRFDQHTVTDRQTGESVALPEHEAWELYKRINIWS